MIYQLIIYLLFIQISKPRFQDNILKLILEKNENKNFMISPFGIYQALSILANGATGQTQKEMLQVLYPNKNIDDTTLTLNKINSNLIQVLEKLSKEDFIVPHTTSLNIPRITLSKKTKGIFSNDIDESIDLDIQDFPEINSFKNNKNIKKNDNLIFNNVNGLFIKKGYNILEEFSLKCKNLNASISELINVSQINSFCYNNTNGKIPKCIEEIEDNVALILINAIYFKGNWSKPFNKIFTKKLPFQNNNNDIVEVDTMYEHFNGNEYYEDDKIQMISLPYSSKKLNFKMIIILPNKNIYSSPLNFLEENINLNELVSKLKYTENINLYLPKFINYFNISLNNILKEMNMKRAFNLNAQFNKLSLIPTFIEEISQKTFIQVDEVGTEAAAVTIVKSKIGSIYNPKEYFMYVNYSFIYMIVSEEIKDSEGNYLAPFIGVVNNLEDKIYNISENSAYKIKYSKIFGCLYMLIMILSI